MAFSHYFFVVKEDLVYMYPSPAMQVAACCLQPQPLTPTGCLHVLNVFIGKITDTLAATIVSRLPGNPLCVLSNSMICFYSANKDNPNAPFLKLISFDILPAVKVLTVQDFAPIKYSLDVQINLEGASCYCEELTFASE